MALISKLNNSIGFGTRIVLAAPNDLLIGPKARIESFSADAIIAGFSNQSITVQGIVATSVGSAIVLGNDPTDQDLKIVVAASGQVTGASYGIAARGTDIVIINRGYVFGESAIYLDAGGATPGRITNYGTLVGDYAIDLEGTGGTRVINTGDVYSAGSLALSGSAASDRVVNKGLMQGVVSLNDGNDVFDNRGGRVVGLIDAGAGDDRFVLNGTRERISGGLGSDTLDFRHGGMVKLSLEGTFDRAGQAQLDEYALFENIYGSLIAADRLGGNEFANLLKGFGGNDTLSGAGANDTLDGGAGRDTLTGGMGNDRFVFDKLADAGDTITDFSYIPGNFDTIYISARFGAGLTAGTLPSAKFKSGNDNLADDANCRFIYNNATDKLLFDRDGTGAAAPILVAIVPLGSVEMVATDIVIF